MKKKIAILLLFVSYTFFAQQKSTGDLSLIPGVTANLTLDNTTSTATLVLSGPIDRWFACKFGNFTTAMSAGVDGVYFDGTTLIDGNGGQLATDAVQDWTVTGITLGTVRTITATRPFNSGDPSDFTFVYANPTIAIAVAHNQNPAFPLEYHGANRSKNTAVTFGTLGVDDFSLNASAVLYPNPSNGSFTIKSKTGVDNIDIYSQTGAFIKTVKVNESGSAEINVDGLSSGVYLIELKNKEDKSWKKVIID
jgi:hypothetical protein